MFSTMNALPKLAPQILGFIYTAGLYVLSMYILSKVIERNVR